MTSGWSFRQLTPMKRFSEKVEEYSIQAQNTNFVREIKDSIAAIDYEDPNLALTKFISILVNEIEYGLHQYSSNSLNEGISVRNPPLNDIKEAIGYYNTELEKFAGSYKSQLKIRDFTELKNLRKGSTRFLQYAYRAAKHTSDKDEANTLFDIISSLIDDNNVFIGLINLMVKKENERRQKISE
jgi:hypothetical protein